MPYKKSRKITKKPYKKKAGKKVARTTMVNRMPIGAHTAFPPKYYTKVYTSNMLYSTVANNNKVFTFVININPYRPYAGYISAKTTAVCGDVTGGFTQLLGTGAENILTGSMSGYAQVSNVYNSYRVHKVKYHIGASPGALGDTSMLTVIPSSSVIIQAIPSMFDIPILNDLQNSRTKLVSSNNVQRDNRITGSFYPHKILGLSKAQYNDQLAPVLGGYPATNYLTGLIVSIATLDSLAYQSILALEVMVELEVEWSNPILQL